MSVEVVKFGGSILKDVNDFGRATDVVVEKLKRFMLPLCVVSAMNGMTDELKASDVDDFLRVLPTLDPMMRVRIERARREMKTIWYLGTADLQNGAYKIGFEEVPLGDPITRARESDNVLKIFPRLGGDL